MCASTVDGQDVPYDEENYDSVCVRGCVSECAISSKLRLHSINSDFHISSLNHTIPF